MSNLSLDRSRPRYLEPESHNDANTSSSKSVMHDLGDMDFLRMWLVKQEAIDRNLLRKREEMILRAFEEKKNLLRCIFALKDKNTRVATSWQPEILTNVEMLRREEQKLLEK